MDEVDLLNLLCGVRTQRVFVAYLAQLEREAIGANSSAVWLSRDTVTKLETKHRDVNLQLYRLMPVILRESEARLLAPRRLVYLYSTPTEPQKHYRAVVKSTRGGAEVYIVSVHRIQQEQIKSTIARSRPLQVFGQKESA